MPHAANAFFCCSRLPITEKLLVNQSVPRTKSRVYMGMIREESAAVSEELSAEAASLKNLVDQFTLAKE